MLTDAAITTTAAATACDMAIEWHSDRSNMVLVAKLVSCWALVGSFLAGWLGSERALLATSACFDGLRWLV